MADHLRSRSLTRSLEAALRPTPDTPVDVSALERSVRVVSDDVIEIERYGVGVLRIGFFIVFLFFLTITTILPLLDGWYRIGHPVLWDQEAYFSAQYDATKAVDDFLVQTDRATYIAERMYGQLFRRELFGLFISPGLPVVLLGVFIFWPRPAPLRVDRKRQAIYTKRWGRLCALPIRRGMVDLDAGLLPSLSFQKTTDWGPVLFDLAPIAGGQAKRLSFGAVPASHPAQSVNVYQAIRSFAAARGTPDWVATLRKRQSHMSPDPLRTVVMGAVIRLGFSSRDLNRIESWRSSL